MTTYEIIDALCDSINPILFFTSIGFLIKQLMKKKYKKAGLCFGFLLASLALVYGVLFIDAKFGLWSSFGSDYSTHTAFALAVCMTLSLCTNATKILIGVLVVYIALMLYQQYHSLLDIITTVVAIGAPLFVARIFVSRLIDRDTTKPKSP